MVRVIAGSARGRKIKTLDSEDTKPTLDRVKEAMFSMVSPYIAGAKVLDLFSGNGSLGIEALSRGADHCLMNDRTSACAKLIRENLVTLGFESRAEVVCDDFSAAIGIAARKPFRYDLILMDPPYRQGLIGKALSQKQMQKLARTEGEDGLRATVALCEHGADEDIAEQYGGFVKIKSRKYGTVGVTLFEFCGEKPGGGRD
ncbi:MAG: 16S rRNA (guanine(966)-N(2))-methyltransferase RsmD [Clostridia bacterium]|nr:16S rRNA (guanine(966)-N(2))-methyltransferase RsmD [Clostridia bacterium]